MSMINIRDNNFKKHVFLSMIEEGVVAVGVTKNNRVVVADHVSVPCILHYGLNMPNPVKDLQVTNEGITAVLSFDRTPWDTFIPWEAVAIMELVDQSFAIRFKKLDLMIGQATEPPKEDKHHGLRSVPIPEDWEGVK